MSNANKSQSNDAGAGEGSDKKKNSRSSKDDMEAIHMIIEENPQLKTKVMVRIKALRKMAEDKAKANLYAAAKKEKE